MAILDPTVITALQNKTHIVGADESGWGAVSGPVVVSGLRAPQDWSFPGLNDSKKLSPARRQALHDQLLPLIASGQIQWHLAIRSNLQIDSMGPYPALKDAYVEVFKSLYQHPDDLIIVDGNMTFDHLGVDHMNKVSLVKADGQVPAVMAASILGKCSRDKMMRDLHLFYPVYNWNLNCGYPNPGHLAAIRTHGYSHLHRRSYKIKSLHDIPFPEDLILKGNQP